MPSEQRLHPATILFEVAKHAKNFAVPAALVFFGASSSGGPGGVFDRMPSGWEVWLLVPFVPAVLMSVVRYMTFRLRFDERELVIRYGLLFRTERHVPYARIQNVDAVQNVVHRLLGVVEVRVETGGGKEEEARLSVLPHAAFEGIRRQVFAGRARTDPAASAEAPAAAPAGDTLVHLPLRELLLCGFLENKGMVLIGAAYGVAWETGILNGFWERLFGEGDTVGRGYVREIVAAIVNGNLPPIGHLGIAAAGVAGFLVVVRVVSMVWALVRLYDFRLTRVDEDLRSEYGLFTKVAATIPLRRVQTITIREGPLHRWLARASVRVETAGGRGGEATTQVREWLAPLIHRTDLPALVMQVVPGFDLGAVAWQPLHPRAFARAVKPMLAATLAVTLVLAAAVGWSALWVFAVLLGWTIVSTRQYVTHVAWADDDEVVMMRSGWIWRQTTVARVNKIQVVAIHQSPFDRRAAMAGVRVDTAGAGELSHRVAIPYLDHAVARGLAERLAAQAANTAFRW